MMVLGRGLWAIGLGRNDGLRHDGWLGSWHDDEPDLTRTLSVLNDRYTEAQKKVGGLWLVKAAERQA
jgi:hypothetical protein